MTGNLLTGQAAGFRHLKLDECNSTNTQCLQYVEAGDPGKLWITATRQTAGKGSRGRIWTSEEGNLFASLLLVNPCDVAHFAELTFVAANAVRRTIEMLLPERDRPTVEVKWPNDVLINGKKVSGILLEGTSTGKSAAIAIGIGINCATHPLETLHPATSLAKHGITIDVNGLFSELAQIMAVLLNQWDSGHNFAAVRNEWIEYAYGIGKPVLIKMPDGEEFEGVFRNIDEYGRLLLKRENKEDKIVSVADVFMLGDLERFSD